MDRREIDSRTSEEGETEKNGLWETDQPPPEQKTEEKLAGRQSNLGQLEKTSKFF